MKTPDNLVDSACALIANFLNTLSENKEMSSLIALRSEKWDAKKQPTITTELLSPTVEITAKDIKDIVEEEGEVEYKMSVEMKNYYSDEILKNTGVFLTKNASIDDITANIEQQLKEYITRNIKKGLAENKKRLRIRVTR